MGELSDQEWLSGTFKTDWSNDTVLASRSVKEIHQDWWGKIGYSREVTNILGAVADHHEREEFGDEVEFVKKITTYVEAVPPDDNHKPVDKEEYATVLTGDQLETEIENNDARNPLELFSVDLGEYEETEGDEEVDLYAATVNYGEHKEVVFNFSVPESH